MKNKILLILVLLLTYSCNSQDKNSSKQEIKNIKKSNSINDSLLIGYPKISNLNFIQNIHEGGFEYFHKYESILKEMNNKFLIFKNENIIIEEEINSIVLRLIRRKIEDNDIEIELQTLKNNEKVDSILFYKYSYDKNVPDNEQRLESLTYIDNEFILWHLETFTNHSEDALGIDEWSKYEINVDTGKINLKEKLKY